MIIMSTNIIVSTKTTHNGNNKYSNNDVDEYKYKYAYNTDKY